MNDMSLSRLYRRLVSTRPAVAVDAVELADAVSSDAAPSAARDAVVADLARSPAHAALARMLRALKPDSEALAASVRESRVVHPQRQRDQRVAAGARRGVHVRRISSIAACFAVVFGLWSWQGAHRHDDVVASTTASPRADRIFTAEDHIFASSDAVPVQNLRRGDQVFRANFASGS
jgi:hypothetical protein